jgi:hypothetical protein
MVGLLIVTVIGSGGPLQRPGTPYHPLLLRNATVLVQPSTRSHPLFIRKTNRQGRVEFHFGPGRYEVSAVLESSRPPVRCQERTVTMSGATQKVRLVCQIK